MILSAIIEIFVIVCFIFLPITAFMAIKCFYDDSIRITRLKIILFAATALLMIMIMAADSSDKVYALKLLSVLVFMYVVQPIIISADRKKRMKYYIENIILHVVIWCIWCQFRSSYA